MQSLRTLSKKELQEYIENIFKDKEDFQSIGTLVTTTELDKYGFEYVTNQIIILNERIES